MKKKNLIIALAMTIAVGLGATAYASTGSTSVSSETSSMHQRIGLARATGTRGYDYAKSILKNKLGMTDKEITDGLNSGKTMYYLAKDKGMTIDEFRKALIEEKSKAIDEAVYKGTITKEQGDSLKENIKNNINNCTGDVTQMHGNIRMTGNRHNGGGANCPAFK